MQASPIVISMEIASRCSIYSNDNPYFISFPDTPTATKHTCSTQCRTPLPKETPIQNRSRAPHPVFGNSSKTGLCITPPDAQGRTDKKSKKSEKKWNLWFHICLLLGTKGITSPKSITVIPCSRLFPDRSNRRYDKHDADVICAEKYSSLCQFHGGGFATLTSQES